MVACLAADALGAGNVRALLLPSQFSSDHSVADAKKLAENLGIEYNVIPITEIYTSVVNTLKPVIGGREFDATEENIQTRIRTVLLMACLLYTSASMIGEARRAGADIYITADMKYNDFMLSLIHISIGWRSC